MRKLCFIFSILCVTAVYSFSQSRQYTNPVLKPGTFGDIKVPSLADPFVFKDTDGTYYMYLTGKGFPAFSSRDLVNWRFEDKVFPEEKRKWATAGFWAPEVIHYNSKYYLHYTGAETKNGIKRIGIAVSDNPLGPFEDLDESPFFQHAINKGSIDSHIFVDDDKRVYLYYSNAMATNTIPGTDKQRSEIWVVELARNLSGTIGNPRLLIYPSQEWENIPDRKSYWNEGAVMLKHNNIYYLMYSANCFCASNYSVGYATSSSPTGPFVKYPGNPVLSNKNVPTVSGPGHHSVVPSPDGTELYCIYHSHVNSSGGLRMINIDKMGFKANGDLYINGPSITPQAYPSKKKK